MPFVLPCAINFLTWCHVLWVFVRVLPICSGWIISSLLLGFWGWLLGSCLLAQVKRAYFSSLHDILVPSRQIWLFLEFFSANFIVHQVKIICLIDLKSNSYDTQRNWRHSSGTIHVLIVLSHLWNLVCLRFISFCMSTPCIFVMRASLISAKWLGVEIPDYTF